MVQPTIPRSEVIGIEGAKRLIEDSRELSRRSFLALVGWGAFVIGSTVALLQSVRFTFRVGRGQCGAWDGYAQQRPDLCRKPRMGR